MSWIEIPLSSRALFLMNSKCNIVATTHQLCNRIEAELNALRSLVVQMSDAKKKKKSNISEYSMNFLDYSLSLYYLLSFDLDGKLNELLELDANFTLMQLRYLEDESKIQMEDLEIGERIAEGSYGLVYNAVHQNNPVAVKYVKVQYLCICVWNIFIYCYIVWIRHRI